MPELRERLSVVCEARKKKHDLYLMMTALGHPERDSGYYKLYLYYRYFSVADYVKSGCKEDLVRNLKTAIEYRKKMYEMHENGESVALSFLNINGYQEVFSALSIGQIDIAKYLFSKFGDFRNPIKDVHIIDYTLGYTLKSFVEENVEQQYNWTKKILGRVYLMCKQAKIC